MMEWKYTEEGIPLIPAEIINPYNSRKSKHLALVDSGSDWCSLPKQLWDDLDFLDIGLLELGTPLGFTEVGFSWCNLNIAGKTIPVEIHYTIGDEILIGRNAMKHFLVTFDGKKGKIIFDD